MNILAVEASTKACSASLKIGKEVIADFQIAPQRHANFLLTQIDDLLSQAGLSGEQLDYLAFGEGPGAFTGVRIAAGVIQGLAYGWQKPVVAVSSLEALAWQFYQQERKTPVVACLDARMKEIYVQYCWFEDGILYSDSPQLLTEHALLTFLEEKKVELGVGDIGDEYPDVMKHFSRWLSSFPSAQAIAEISAQRTDQAVWVEQQVPVPVYLRNNVADKKQPV